MLLLGGATGLLSAGLLMYAVTAAFAWDEGYHLLAAQLIRKGEMPYRDFVFPQTPLNAYWNALWMWLFGDTWRTAHVVAALLSGGAILMSADYVLRRFPVNAWRLAAALTVALTVGLNAMILEYGTVGQAYGCCLFLIVAAFRFAVRAVGETRFWVPGAAGFLAGAAAGSSLLTAPVAPILLIWIWFQNIEGRRLVKLGAFLAGLALAWMPIVYLAAVAPRQTFFSIIEYQLFYRQVEWQGAIPHDLGVLTDWLDSTQALLLGLLALTGLAFVFFRSNWDRRLRAELYLCGWLALSLAAHISTAHPTFARYYLFAVPFLGILGAVGLYSVAVRMIAPDRTLWPVLALTILTAAGLAKSLSHREDHFFWRTFEDLARKAGKLTPPGALLLADEHVYFLTRRAPPSGMEIADSHKLRLPAPLAAQFHVLSRTALDQQIRDGMFATVVTCEEQEPGGPVDLAAIYAHKAEIRDCAVFWGRRP